MSRLRIRIELSRRGLGVPLNKLGAVVDDTQKFLALLSEDIGIEKGKGEWLVFDFDRANLDFTAEYVGQVTPDQVKAFNAAFDGTTSLRQATIAQFARITDSIGEDEVIGFGLFESDEAEPTEWRCLSRRDALRIAEEIQVLSGSSEEVEQQSHLPAVRDERLEDRIFRDRRGRAIEQSGIADYVRSMESSLSKRITQLEGQVKEHAGIINDLDEQSASTEASVRSLMSSIEAFCDQATRQIEGMSPAGLLNAPQEEPHWLHRWWPALAGAAALVGAVVIISTAPAGSQSPVAEETAGAALAETLATPAEEAPSTPESRPVDPDPVQPPAVNPPSDLAALPASAVQVDVEAVEPAWVALSDVDGNRLIYRTLEAGETRTVELATPATLRTGNAGGLLVRVGGQPVGPIGPPGAIREIHFENGAYTILEPPS